MKHDHRLARATRRLTALLPLVAVRGQLGPVRETELARLTGARR